MGEGGGVSKRFVDLWVGFIVWISFMTPSRQTPVLLGPLRLLPRRTALHLRAKHALVFETPKLVFSRLPQLSSVKSTFPQSYPAPISSPIQIVWSVSHFGIWIIDVISLLHAISPRNRCRFLCKLPVDSSLSNPFVPSPKPRELESILTSHLQHVVFF